MTRRWTGTAAVLAASLLIGDAASSAPAPATARATAMVRLYTLDCGRIDFDDEKVFADTGEHDGEKAAMPVPCFLIRHGDEWLLWDAGLGDEIAASPGGRTVVGLRFRVPVTLASQLAALKLRPDDIRYVAVSHLHADHSGNIPLFPHATLLVSPQEYAWAAATPTPDGVRAEVVASIDRARIRPVPADLDVFGDGTVTMVSTPGHTPGHHSLLVRLKNAGPVILSGDVAHFQVNYDRALVPTGNVSRSETLASIDRVKGLAATYRARVIIQHGADIFSVTPRFPAYLD